MRREPAQRRMRQCWSLQNTRLRSRSHPLNALNVQRRIWSKLHKGGRVCSEWLCRQKMGGKCGNGEEAEGFGVLLITTMAAPLRAFPTLMALIPHQPHLQPLLCSLPLLQLPFHLKNELTKQTGTKCTFCSDVPLLPALFFPFPQARQVFGFFFSQKRFYSSTSLCHPVAAAPLPCSCHWTR